MGGSLLTRLRFRIALWCQARSMPFRVRPSSPLVGILVFVDCASSASYAGLTAAYILKHVVEVTRRPFFMRGRRCLRQGLLAFRFMKAAGYDVELHFGIDRTDPQNLRAHCWIVHDGRVALNSPDASMQAILVHKATAPAAGDVVDLTASSFR